MVADALNSIRLSITFYRRVRRERRELPLQKSSWVCSAFYASSAVKAFDLIRSEVRKLQVNSEIVALQESYRFLERVAILAADAHQVSLNRCLRLLLGVFYQLHNLARLLDRDALL